MLQRIGGENGHREQTPNTIPVEVFLLDLKNERDCLISRLRHIDKVLIDYGILKNETIPRRTR